MTFDISGGLRFRIAGWDEVFPTIEPHGGIPMMGCLVRLAPTLEVEAGRVRQTWHGEGFTAERAFTAESQDRLRVDFAVTNTTAQAIPFLWASHPMLAIDRLRAVDLPDGSRLQDFSPDGSERKWFLPVTGPVWLYYPDCSFEISTDQAYWGLWLDKGGWPPENPGEAHCLGVEATNTPAEVPLDQRLDAGKTFRGTVILQGRPG